MAFIVSLIQQAIIDDLLEALRDKVASDDPARAALVRIGPLQEDPTKPVVSLMVDENDPADPESWPHCQKDTPMGQPQNGNIHSGYFEIGGSELYLRRFTVTAKIFLVRKGMSRVEAKAVIDMVHGRAIQALRFSSRIIGLHDEFDEVVLDVRSSIAKSYMVLRGGPPESWIGEGKLWLSVTTQLP